MLKTFARVLLAMCLPFLVFAQSGSSETLKQLKNRWEAVSEDRRPTLREVDEVMAAVEALLKSPNRWSYADEKAARLMVVGTYLAKYSLLESPDFTNTKGGPAMRQKARGELEYLLKLKPDDKDVLTAYQSLLASMGVDTYPIARKIVDLHPKDSWAHFVLGQMEFQRKNNSHAIQSMARAIETADNPKLLAMYVEAATNSLQDANCPPDARWQKLQEEIPMEFRYGTDPYLNSAKIGPEMKRLQGTLHESLRKHRCAESKAPNSHK